MFKEDQIILYPNHGAGKIESISKLDGSDNGLSYFNIIFFDSDISISVPVKNAVGLGLRAMPTKKELTQELSDLGEEIEVDEEKAKLIRSMNTHDLNTTDVVRIVKIVNEIESYKKQKEKGLEMGLRSILIMAKKFLVSAIEQCLNKGAINNYPTLLTKD